jgi:phosphotransferase system HPr-like phosphotransfer protein
MTNSFPNLELTIKQGKYVVDGRSLMGIFSLNLLQDMMLEIICLHDDISIGVFLDNLVELDILVEELE